eukprot:2473155-Prymnesium_polylepis.1
MGALHSMRVRGGNAASSPTRPWWLRSAMTSTWTGLHNFLGAGAVGAGHFTHGSARPEEFSLFSFMM